MQYTIQNGNLKAVINNKGAELVSLKTTNGKEYIWYGDPKYWKSSSPVLFPIVGSLKNKQTYINGNLYDLNQHGFLREQIFTVLKETASSISFVAEDTEDTLKRYPFKFKAIITHTLDQKTIRTTFHIFNKDTALMPFNIGGHPGILCPLYEGEKFNDYTITFEHEESFQSPKVEEGGLLNFDEAVLEYDKLKVLPLNYDLFDIDTIIIKRVKSSYVYLTNKVNKGVKFSFPNFKTLAIWSPPGKEAPYLCLEPWIGYNDLYDTDQQFIKKDSIITLEPLKDFSVYYEISIID